MLLTQQNICFIMRLEMMHMTYTYNNEVRDIWNTKMLIENIQKINILDYERLKEIANRIELLDKNYTFELKQIILDKADIIKLNNLHKKCNNDDNIKKELLENIREIAYYYGVNSNNQKNENNTQKKM